MFVFVKVSLLIFAKVYNIFCFKGFRGTPYDFIKAIRKAVFLKRSFYSGSLWMLKARRFWASSSDLTFFLISGNTDSGWIKEANFFLYALLAIHIFISITASTARPITKYWFWIFYWKTSRNWSISNWF